MSENTRPDMPIMQGGRIPRRAFLTGVAAVGGSVAASSLLAACGGGQTSTTQSGGPKTINVWFPYALVPPEGQKANTYSELLAEFNKGQSRYQVQVSTSNWDPQKLVTAVTGGSPPDLFFMDRYLAAEWAARNIVEPLDNRLAGSGAVTKKDIWPKLLNDVTWKGKTFGVPIYTDVRAFYWNKDIFSQVGLAPDQPPQSWDDLKSAIKSLYVTGPQGIQRLGYAPSLGNPPGFLMWYIHLWQLGGEFMNSDKTKVAFNNDAGVGAMQFLLDTFEAQGGYPEVAKFATGLNLTPAADAFMIGKMAMEVNGDWVPATFQRYVPNLRWGVSELPLPSGGRKSNYNGGHAWVIPRGAKNKDGAWAVIEWFLTSQHQLRLGLGENVIPSRQAVAKSKDYLQGAPADRAPMRQLFVNEFSYSKWVPVVPGVSQIFNSNSQTFDQIMRKVVTPKVGVAQMAQQCQQILDSAPGR